MVRISVVTTTLNAMPYIVETTRSVLQNDYPNLEYVLIDAGSSDGTLEHLNSIRDSRVKVDVIKGITPYQAVDQGFRNATGDVLAWINGDDLYYKWTLPCVGRVFTEFPDVQWITGIPTLVNSEGHRTSIGRLASYPKKYIRNGWFNESAFGFLQQESMFWRKSLYEQAGGLNLKYNQAADFELWIRMAQHAPLVGVNVPLGAFRKHGANRSIRGSEKYLGEIKEVVQNQPKIGRFKSYLFRASTATKQAMCLAEWHRTSWIQFSAGDHRCTLRSGFKPCGGCR